MGFNDNMVNEVLKTFKSSFDKAWRDWTPEKIDTERFWKIFPTIDPLRYPEKAAEKIHRLVLGKLKGGIGETIDISFIENLSDKLYLNIKPPAKIKKGSILEEEFYDLQQSLSPNYCHIILAAALARVVKNWQHPIAFAPDCTFRIYQDYEGDNASFLLDFSRFNDYADFKETLINTISVSHEEKAFFELLSTWDGTNYSGVSIELLDNPLAFISSVADKAKLNLFE